MRVALLGTGTMGAGMARSVKRAGIDVAAWNRTREKAEPLADDGVEVADTVADAVTGADVVITMLFDADAVLEHAKDIVEALGPDAVWLQSSTVGPDGIRRIADAAGGAKLLDAPMLGTKEPADQGKLVPLVSGPQDLIGRVQPVLDAVGTKTVVAGGQIGDASALKLACNAWILSITAAAAQSIAIAQALGVDAAKVLEAFDGGPANAPYLQLKAKAMLDGDFSPSFGLDGGRKDLGLIADAAAAAGVRTTLLEGVRAMYDTASQDGHGTDDLAAVYTSFTAKD